MNGELQCRNKAFRWNSLMFRYFISLTLCFAWLSGGEAAELEIRIDNPPERGAVVALLFNSSSTFVDLREPVKAVTLDGGAVIQGRIADLPAGEYALVVYHDENGNGRLDRNFIGIPSEPLGFSNRYRPHGPPTYSRAAFNLQTDETKSIDVALQSVFGKRGMVGLGVGLISRTSPYRDARRWDFKPIPAVSYIGDRFQLVGLTAQYGLMEFADCALAAKASYRFGAYREDDSSYLDGMGDREDTLTGGLSFNVKLPGGVKLSAGYEHDLLDRSGGGTGSIGLQKSFQDGLLTITPQVAFHWLTADLADYNYGVTAEQSREWRPAYRPGDAVTLEVGVTLFREIFTDWRVILSGNVVFLPDTITDSPLVEQSQTVTSFFAITRLF